jgi:hypothetical protein
MGKFEDPGGIHRTEPREKPPMDRLVRAAMDEESEVEPGDPGRIRRTEPGEQAPMGRLARAAVDVIRRGMGET